jgi:hypothetical protein
VGELAAAFLSLLSPRDPSPIGDPEHQTPHTCPVPRVYSLRRRIPGFVLISSASIPGCHSGFPPLVRDIGMLEKLAVGSAAALGSVS